MFELSLSTHLLRGLEMSRVCPFTKAVAAVIIGTTMQTVMVNSSALLVAANAARVAGTAVVNHPHLIGIQVQQMLEVVQSSE